MTRGRLHLFARCLTTIAIAACGAPGSAGPDAGTACRGGTSACDLCGYESCCSEAQTCANNAQCTAAYACSAQCAGNVACQDRCSAAHPGGADEATALAVCLTSNCSSECSTPANVDPTGTWNLAVTIDDSSCGGGTSHATRMFMISGDPGAYTITANIRSSTTTGMLTCTPQDCALSVTTSFPNSIVGEQTEVMSLTLFAAGATSGTGSIKNSDCFTPMTVTGYRAN